MSVWIPYLRSSPPGGRPGWGSGPRPRSPSRRVPARGLVVGVRVTRACHRWARRSPRCCEPGEGRCGRSLRPRRTPRRDIGISFVRRSSWFSSDHGCVRPRSRSPRDRASSMSASRPTPVRLRPEAELVCHPGDRSGLRPGLGGTLADQAHGVLVLSGGVARRRRAVRARVARPALWAVLSWLLPPPTVRPSGGTRRRHRAPPGHLGPCRQDTPRTLHQTADP